MGFFPSTSDAGLVPGFCKLFSRPESFFPDSFFPDVLTDWVVAETGNGLARTPVRGRFVAVAGGIFSE